MRRRSLLSVIGTATIAGCLGDSEIDGYESGEIEIRIDDEPVDLTEDRYQAEHAEAYSIDFHFHEFDDRWYMEGERITFAEAIDLIPHFSHDWDDDGHVLTHDEEVYDSQDPSTEITFIANGETIDPTTFDISDGDDLLIKIETNE